MGQGLPPHGGTRASTAWGKGFHRMGQGLPLHGARASTAWGKGFHCMGVWGSFAPPLR